MSLSRKKIEIENRPNNNNNNNNNNNFDSSMVWASPQTKILIIMAQGKTCQIILKLKVALFI